MPEHSPQQPRTSELGDLTWDGRDMWIIGLDVWDRRRRMRIFFFFINEGKPILRHFGKLEISVYTKE